MKLNIIKNRRNIQILAAGAIFALYQIFHIELWVIIVAGSALGIVFGKVFCRWACPIGFVMELMFRGDKQSKAKQMYQYHKLGCPIAWVSGFLNKFSLFKVKRNADSCTSCGLCDKKCYISTLNEDFSLYKEEKSQPAESFNCSKCLECVDACPNESLKYTF